MRKEDDILIDSCLAITCAEIVTSEELAMPDPSGEVTETIAIRSDSI